MGSGPRTGGRRTAGTGEQARGAGGAPGASLLVCFLMALAGACLLWSALPQAAPAESGPDAPSIVFLGDSLSAGYGLAPEDAFPSLIQDKLRQAGYPQRVINAGVSGDTSAGGLARLNWVLRGPVQVLIVEVGGNDGLRGQSPEAMERNLAAIIQRGQAAGATVLLAAIPMPTNYGPEYTRRFDAVFPTLARRYHLPLIPLLRGVALRPDLNQADGIHPNAQGARVVAENVWRVLRPVLEKLPGQS